MLQHPSHTGAWLVLEAWARLEVCPTITRLYHIPVIRPADSDICFFSSRVG